MFVLVNSDIKCRRIQDRVQQVSQPENEVLARDLARGIKKKQRSAKYRPPFGTHFLNKVPSMVFFALTWHKAVVRRDCCYPLKETAQRNVLHSTLEKIVSGEL